MIQKLAVNISAIFCRCEVIKEDEREICRYGLEIIISTIVGFSVILGVGGIFHEFTIAVLYLLLIVPLRMYTGGYHADTYGKCNLVFGAVFVAVLIGYNMIIYWSLYIPVLALSIASFVIIWRLGPIENKNKPLREERQRYRRISLMISGSYYLISLLLSALGIEYGVIFSLVIDTVAILMMGGEKNGEIHKKHFRQDCQN